MKEKKFSTSFECGKLVDNFIPIFSTVENVENYALKAELTTSF